MERDQTVPIVVNSQAQIQSMLGTQQTFLLTPHVVALETKGVVYTKRWVVELVLDLAGYVASANLVDATAIEPAAGEGAFLVPMIERLIKSCRTHGRAIPDCRASLITYELDEVSAACARSIVTEILVGSGLDTASAADLADSWVRTGDYLLDPPIVAADFVVGNPPYIRLEDIPEESAAFYRKSYPTMRGRADLYIAFFEAALRQLKDGGVCAFICADRWMRNQYGSNLRELVTSSFSVDVVIEMHNAKAFHDEVDAYPAVTVIRRGQQGPAIVASAGPEVEELSSHKLAAVLRGAHRAKAESMPLGLQAARVESWFAGSVP